MIVEGLAAGGMADGQRKCNQRPSVDGAARFMRGGKNVPERPKLADGRIDGNDAQIVVDEHTAKAVGVGQDDHG